MIIVVDEFFYCFVLVIVSRLGDIRSEHDANCTYEGENNVLIQQASNWLLNQWSNVINKKPIVSPMGSADFLENAHDILQTKFHCYNMTDVLKPESTNNQ